MNCCLNRRQLSSILEVCFYPSAIIYYKFAGKNRVKNPSNVSWKEPPLPPCCLVGFNTVLWDRLNVLRPMQTDATLLANIKQHCRAQHVASVCMEPHQCWHLLRIVWNQSKFWRNKSQHFYCSVEQSAPFAWSHSNACLVKTSVHAHCNLFQQQTQPAKS